MQRILLMFFLMVTFLLGKEDYSEMSNQELIAILGYVKDEDKSSYEKELSSRLPLMNEDEKKEYEKIKQEIQNNENQTTITGR